MIEIKKEKHFSQELSDIYSINIYRTLYFKKYEKFVLSINLGETLCVDSKTLKIDQKKIFFGVGGVSSISKLTDDEFITWFREEDYTKVWFSPLIVAVKNFQVKKKITCLNEVFKRSERKRDVQIMKNGNCIFFLEIFETTKNGDSSFFMVFVDIQKNVLLKCISLNNLFIYLGEFRVDDVISVASENFVNSLYICSFDEKGTDIMLLYDVEDEEVRCRHEVFDEEIVSLATYIDKKGEELYVCGGMNIYIFSYFKKEPIHVLDWKTKNIKGYVTPAYDLLVIQNRYLLSRQQTRIAIHDLQNMNKLVYDKDIEEEELFLIRSLQQVSIILDDYVLIFVECGKGSHYFSFMKIYGLDISSDGYEFVKNDERNRCEFVVEEDLFLQENSYFNICLKNLKITRIFKTFF